MIRYDEVLMLLNQINYESEEQNGFTQCDKDMAIKAVKRCMKGLFLIVEFYLIRKDEKYEI